ncbi:MAG TPA: vWA domain-containing protein [Polyangiales bacterium]|nr:vWA domain-containing protein [Polyangiales bacterium]
MRASRWQVLTLCSSLLAACGGSSNTTSKSDEPSTARDAGSSEAGKKAPIDPAACQKIQLPSDPAEPEILIVQDRSGSMVGLGDIRNAGKNRWQPSVRALKKLTSELTETVAFGLMLFPATSGGVSLGGGAGCDPGKLDVEVATGSATQIASVLDRSAPDVGATPTAASLTAALGALDTGLCPDCRVAPKYVLLVTDGQPTCGVGGTKTLPEDIEATNKAIDALHTAGIKTYVIGYDTASDQAAAIAMDGFARHGGTDKYLPVEDESSLLAELTRIAGELVPCEFELSDDVEDPSFVRVEIDGVSYEYEQDWLLEGRTVRLLERGGACPKLRDARLHRLAITRECAPVMLI